MNAHFPNSEDPSVSRRAMKRFERDMARDASQRKRISDSLRGLEGPDQYEASRDAKEDQSSTENQSRPWIQYAVATAVLTGLAGILGVGMWWSGRSNPFPDSEIRNSDKEYKAAATLAVQDPDALMALHLCPAELAAEANYQRKYPDGSDAALDYKTLSNGYKAAAKKWETVNPTAGKLAIDCRADVGYGDPSYRINTAELGINKTVAIHASQVVVHFSVDTVCEAWRKTASDALATRLSPAQGYLQDLRVELMEDQHIPCLPE